MKYCVMCETEKRVVVLERGREESKNFCIVSRPACEVRMRGIELVEEEEMVLMCAFLLIRQR